MIASSKTAYTVTLQLDGEEFRKLQNLVEAVLWKESAKWNSIVTFAEDLEAVLSTVEEQLFGKD